MAPTRPGLSGPLRDADLRLLRVFRAVVENGGLSPAAPMLNTSVSAISIAVGDLEKRLGMKLCQRGRAGFALTEQGEQVYSATLELLAATEHFRGVVNSLHDRLRGELNIGITDNLVTMYRHMRVTNSLAALRRRGPEVRINIHMMPPPAIEHDVIEGRLHVGVVPRTRAGEGLLYTDLYGEESRLYCGHLHPLFAAADDDDPAAILASPAVVPTGNQPAGARQLLGGMQAAATASDREGTAFLVLSGEYIGFLPVHYAERWVNEGRMRALLPGRFSFQTDYAAITRRAGRPGPVLLTYLEELERAENDRPGF
jgi:DNA-binding transcriptional LysR family regulator